MSEYVEYLHREHDPESILCNTERFGAEIAERSRKFHKSFPGYAPTPLANLQDLAEDLGVTSVWVKDESQRFGLNAFKGLGGSYCIGRYIAERLGTDISELSYERITSDEVRKRIGQITFVTATDGNHGRGIAWTAKLLGQKSVVYMPHGSSAERLGNIKALGADASITDMNYDDTVRFAEQQAEKNGWVLVQDTSWEGYEKIPSWIMEGYTTMGAEIREQLNGQRPTHIFLQAGVGAMSGAMTGFFADLYKGSEKPIITIVEPNKADCIYKTAKADDGRLHAVTGSMNTIMAGLACGEPCSVGWEMLRDYADNFVSMPDFVAAKGMRILGCPTGSDPRVISGESGAAAFGLFAETMQSRSLEGLRRQLKLDGDSRVLCISTEGDTDKANYRRIVWDGLYPSF